jgi:NAD(P)-dependent dehydrogenase (short-subunit alcohol dehydrogenase family)
VNQPFAGQSCLVTGAGSGIGAATAGLLAGRGARIAVVGLPGDPLDETVAVIEKAGGTAVAIPAGVSVADDMQHAVDRAVAEFGALDLAVNATNPLSRRIAYTASKFGLIGLTKVAAKDYAGHGIRINALSPGITDTPMMRAGGAQSGEIAAAVPVKRIAQPEEMARGVAYLLSAEAGYVTGAELVVDGGLLPRP